MKTFNMFKRDPVPVPEELLEQVAGGSGSSLRKPSDVGNPVNQYAVMPGVKYYYHYTGGGHDAWLVIMVNAVYEKSKHILWFTERFAVVTYENGMTGELPLDTGDIFFIKGYLWNADDIGGSNLIT